MYISIDELQRELHQNTIDLLSDLLALECLICYQNNPSLTCQAPIKVYSNCLRRTADYIEQHTKEICSICDTIIKKL